MVTVTVRRAPGAREGMRQLSCVRVAATPCGTRTTRTRLGMRLRTTTARAAERLVLRTVSR